MQTETSSSRSSTTASTIPLSIVVATTKPWPEIRACLDSLLGQSKSVGAEILVADGHGRGLPEMDKEFYKGLMWLKNPGASVFGLRKLGMSHAQGEIIAITEDHCRVAPNWCEQVIQAHKDYPDAAAIGGVVENGATTSLMDWANFFLVFAPFVSPIRNGPSERICLQANISYKRRVVSRMASQLGVMEMLFTRQLRQEGEVLMADDRLLVSHVQSHGFGGTFAAHFHNGRSIAGFRLEELGGMGRILRLGSTAILPPYLLWSTLRSLMGKQEVLGKVFASLPLLALLVCCHAAGEFIGYMAGPGQSPQRLA
ncbi:MAG: glycosyltransferase [Nitrospirales bacterium]|nr:glycosyltransferase [Nitrospira sp.]MDR4460411.1 glycosyltransferase [Nitrospirales bacterium]MDR4482309.1 glycosyltransferase [Nitrospirales bacterium]